MDSLLTSGTLGIEADLRPAFKIHLRPSIACWANLDCPVGANKVNSNKVQIFAVQGHFPLASDHILANQSFRAKPFAASTLSLPQRGFLA